MLVALRAGRRGHALPGRGDRDRAGGRGDDPDLERLDVLLARLAPASRCATPAGVRVVRPDRRVRRALRQRLHARLLPRHYGAVHLWRGRWRTPRPSWRPRCEDFSRSRPAWVGRRARVARRAAPAPGHGPRTPCGCSTGPARPRRRGSAVPGSRSSAASRAQAVDLLERCCGRAAGRARPRPRARARAARRTRAPRAASSRRPPQALEALRAVALAVGTAPLRACADMARGGARGGRRRPRARCVRCSRTRVDAFERGGAPFEAARARIELATSLVALGRRAEAAERELRAARERLMELGRGRRGRAGGRILALLGAPRRMPCGR